MLHQRTLSLIKYFQADWEIDSVWHDYASMADQMGRATKILFMVNADFHYVLYEYNVSDMTIKCHNSLATGYPKYETGEFVWWQKEIASYLGRQYSSKPAVSVMLVYSLPI